jgi:hypothetical protein
MIQERKHNRTNFNANKMPLIYVKGCKEKCILMKAAAPTQFKTSLSNHVSFKRLISFTYSELVDFDIA